MTLAVVVVAAMMCKDETLAALGTLQNMVLRGTKYSQYQPAPRGRSTSLEDGIGSGGIELPVMPQRLFKPKMFKNNISDAAMVTRHDASKICVHLPRRWCKHNWKMLFSTDLHGYSLQTLYARCGAHHTPSVLVAMDDKGATFGAYNSSAWRASGDYKGTGETFVFSVQPDLNVYKWTGANDQFVLMAHTSLCFGGGGSLALCLDSSLEKGVTTRCKTFNNKSLASTKNFRCVKVEVWGFCL